MWYELWDVASGSLIADFDSENEAVEAARAYITPGENGPAVDVSLIVYHDDGCTVQCLEGEMLATWHGDSEGRTT